MTCTPSLPSHGAIVLAVFVCAYDFICSAAGSSGLSASESIRRPASICIFLATVLGKPQLAKPNRSVKNNDFLRVVPVMLVMMTNSIAGITRAVMTVSF